ncbi:hypothetical protein U8C44_05765 (plasmid) [Sinorhizobium meliloti]|nr:hypothetical protein U8C44_05765 [Sinorhizobium meliloti]
MAARVSRAIAAIEANAGQAVEAAAEEVIDLEQPDIFLEQGIALSGCSWVRPGPITPMIETSLLHDATARSSAASWGTSPGGLY